MPYFSVRQLHKLFILLAIYAPLTLHSACKLSESKINADRSGQSAPAILSVLAVPAMSGSSQVYVLNQRRGKLEPTEEVFPFTQGEELLAFGAEVVSWNGVPVMRLQIELEPMPKFIIVPELESIELAEPIAPDFVAVVKADCPLYATDLQSSQRLYPTGRLAKGTRVYLFDPAEVSFVNIILAEDWREMSPTRWISRNCIDYPTPWVQSAADDISALDLGASDAPFVRQLAFDFGVPWNLRLSDRETGRRSGETCDDILWDLPHTAPLLINYTDDTHAYQMEPYLAAPIYICAEYLISEQRYVYHMRPSVLTLPKHQTMWPGQPGAVDLLVFNLSPSSTIGFAAQAWEIEASPAFGDGEEAEDEGEGGEAEEDEIDPELLSETSGSTLEIYALQPGVDQAIWVQVFADPESDYLNVTYGAGPNPSDLDTDDDSVEQWFVRLKNRGKIVTVR